MYDEFDPEEILRLNNQERLKRGFNLLEKGKPIRDTSIGIIPALRLDPMNGWTPIPTVSFKVSKKDRKYRTRNEWLKSKERREIIESRRRKREENEKQ